MDFVPYGAKSFCCPAIASAWVIEAIAGSVEAAHSVASRTEVYDLAIGISLEVTADVRTQGYALRLV